MKKLNWITIYALVLAIFFAIGGTMNLAASEATLADYTRWGYPTWFPYLTGTLEWTAAILLAFSATRLIGSALAGSVMIAAAGTLVLNGEFTHSIAPLTVLILVGINAFVHFKRDN